MTFDHIRVAFLDEGGQPLDGRVFRFLHLGRIDHNQFFPAAVVGKRNTQEVIGRGGLRIIRPRRFFPAESKHLDLHPFELFERQVLEKGPARGRQVMLDRVGQSKKITVRLLQSIAQRDQLLPAVHRDAPAILEIAGQFLRLDPEIGHVGITPDKRMERLGFLDRGTVLLPPINVHRPSFTQLDRHDPGRWISAKKKRVLLQFHNQRFRDFFGIAKLRRTRLASGTRALPRPARPCVNWNVAGRALRLPVQGDCNRGQMPWGRKSNLTMGSSPRRVRPMADWQLPLQGLLLNSSTAQPTQSALPSWR